MGEHDSLYGCIPADYLRLKSTGRVDKRLGQESASEPKTLGEMELKSGRHYSKTSRGWEMCSQPGTFQGCHICSPKDSVAVEWKPCCLPGLNPQEALEVRLCADCPRRASEDFGASMAGAKGVRDTGFKDSMVKYHVALLAIRQELSPGGRGAGFALEIARRALG